MDLNLGLVLGLGVLTAIWFWLKRPTIAMQIQEWWVGDRGAMVADPWREAWASLGFWLAIVAIADLVLILLPRLSDLPAGLVPNLGLFLGLLGLITLWLIVERLNWVQGLRNLRQRIGSFSRVQTYQALIAPDLPLFKAMVVLAIADGAIGLTAETGFLRRTEFVISLALAIGLGLLFSRIFKRIFNSYILDVTVSSGSTVNSEFLVLFQLVVNTGIIVSIVILFAQTHEINVLGLIASLGIGGLAVAFAAQRTLEQLLGGIVLFIDRPFVVGNYIGLSDGTFGKVESIGLRSTKIRTSGKGTLMIVPNSSLTQAYIENFTDAKKVISILNLNLDREIPKDERALIRQVILESTDDIFGVDSRSTSVSFRSINRDRGIVTQAQITFFILGSRPGSLELRRQILDIANQNIARRLKEFGIVFSCEEPTIYVDSPITI